MNFKTINYILIVIILLLFLSFIGIYIYSFLNSDVDIDSNTELNNTYKQIKYIENDIELDDF